nr:hypothetical protein [bacterium]
MMLPSTLPPELRGRYLKQRALHIRGGRTLSAFIFDRAMALLAAYGLGQAACWWFGYNPALSRALRIVPLLLVLAYFALKGAYMRTIGENKRLEEASRHFFLTGLCLRGEDGRWAALSPLLEAMGYHPLGPWRVVHQGCTLEAAFIPALPGEAVTGVDAPLSRCQLLITAAGFDAAVCTAAHLRRIHLVDGPALSAAAAQLQVLPSPLRTVVATLDGEPKPTRSRAAASARQLYLCGALLLGCAPFCRMTAMWLLCGAAAIAIGLFITLRRQRAAKA